jgi:hypothetical protein
MGRIQPGLIPRGKEERIIHIWWGGLKRNGDLMLLLAHLITRNPEWRSAGIRILSVASNEHMKASTESCLAKLIPAIRISADATVMIRPKDRTIREIIHAESREADIAFLGLDPPDRDEELEGYAQRMAELADGLRTVFFVKNASLFVGQLVQPTEEMATALPGPPEAQRPTGTG